MRLVGRLIVAEADIPVRPEDLRRPELAGEALEQLLHRAEHLLLVDRLVAGPVRLRVVRLEALVELQCRRRPAAERHPASLRRGRPATAADRAVRPDLRESRISGAHPAPGPKICRCRCASALLSNEKSCSIVSRDDLTVRQRAVLFALLGEARQVANPELEQLIGVRLDGAERRDLNDRRLVESTRAGRAFAHELSDAGWRWCAQELAAAPVGRGSSLERAHYRVFAVFARYLDAAGLSLADIVRPEPEPEPETEPARVEAEAAEADLTACIEAGYR